MMGPGIAAVLALAGHQVTLVGRSDATLQRGLQAASTAIETLCREGLATRDRATHVVGTTHLAQAIAEAQFVFESIVEDLAAKQQLFQELERVAPKTAIFASNTSGLPITKIAEQLQHPE